LPGLKPGQVSGLLSSGTGDASLPQPVVPAVDTRHWLNKIVSGQPPARADEAKMYAFFHVTLLSEQNSLRETIPTHEERLALATGLAKAISPGTTRAEIEKVFPQSDGGAFGSDRGRYYFGSEVMIDVPFDTTGGAFQPGNRVTGPLRVYRSMMHLD